MPINNILKQLKDLLIKSKPKKDWSKSDREVLDNFAELRKKREELYIQPLNQSSYNDRRFQTEVSPDFTGNMGFAGIGTKDRMPGTTPTKEPEPKHRKKLKTMPRSKPHPHSYI